jgi:hypothetical protein
MSSKLQNYKVKTKWCNLNLLDYTHKTFPPLFFIDVQLYLVFV